MIVGLKFQIGAKFSPFTSTDVETSGFEEFRFFSVFETQMCVRFKFTVQRIEQLWLKIFLHKTKATFI